ncbi:hypothetical protein BC831DRAFT_514016 [Entophlyctis helioformis]|nr:hypothetical protein BC831DRAFT_514016 [Entophlyctis helioformis]
MQPSVYDMPKKENQERIAILITENDNLIDQNRQSAMEIDALRQQVAKYSKTLQSNAIEMEGSKAHVRSLEQEIHELKNGTAMLEREVKDGHNEVSVSHADIDALQTELRRKEQELDACHSRIDELKRAVAHVSDRYQSHLKESAVFAVREKELLDDLKSKSATLDEYQVKHSKSAKENEEIKQENERLQTVNKSLEKKILLLEKKELAALEGIQQRTHELEEALFERDKSLEREARAKLEISELNNKLNEMPAKYLEKNESAISLLRNQFNIDRRKFADETAKLETLVATLHNQIERAIREKRAAEAELETLTRHIPAEADRLTMTLEEMHCKLRASERERAEAIHKVESIHQKLVREQNSHEAERQQLAHRAEEAYRRLRKSSESWKRPRREERITMHKKLSALEHDNKTLNETRVKKQMQFESELAALTQKYEGQVSDLTSKLDNVTEAHSRTCREMQQLLTDQRRLGDKWRDESKRMTEHYENAMAHLRSQVAQHQTKIAELETQIQRAGARHRDLMEQIGVEKREHTALHARCVNAESRVESLGRQIGTLVGKEAELLEERKRLQRDLDRAVMEKERLEKDSRYHTKQELGMNSARLRAVAEAVDRSLLHTATAAATAAGEASAHSQQAMDLEAEIARVKQRSRAGARRGHGYEPHQPSYRREQLQDLALDMADDSD